MSNGIEFVEKLAEEFSELRSVLRDHEELNDGEIHPHRLMADYCRAAISAEKNSNWVILLLQFLEEKFSNGDDPVSNLIAVSFIEHLPRSSMNLFWIINCLGAKMRQYYQRNYWRDGDYSGPKRLLRKLEKWRKDNPALDDFKEGTKLDPPWIMFPHIPRGSIGWRMGPGEDYWHGFRKWYRNLSPEKQAAYAAGFPEEGKWVGYYQTLIS